jgi:hypothetical protein
MKSVKKAVAAGAVLVCVMLATVVVAGEGPVGEWEFKSQVNARTSEATMTITKNAEGKLEGTWTTQRGEGTLSDIMFEGGKVKFVQTMKFQGQEFKTTYEGTLEGGKLKGTAKGERGESTFEGTLSGTPKSGAEAICGEWKMTVNTPAREVVERMTITKDANGVLAGKWVGQRGENAISDVKFEGGKLTFTRSSKMGDREITSTFSGTVEGDQIKGVFSSERGDRDANATRVGAKKPEPSKAEPNKPATNKPAGGK